MRLKRTSAAFGACAVLWGGGAHVAAAEPAVNGRHFGPTPVLSPYLSLDGTRSLGESGLGVHLLGSYERRPMIFERDGDRTEDLVAERWATDLAIAYGLFERLDVGLNVPVIVRQNGIGPEGTGLDAQAIGDPSVGLKLSVLEKTSWPVGVAVVGQGTAPLGGGEAMAGEAGPTFAGRLAVERPFGTRLDVAVNLGYRSRPETRVHGLRLDDELTAGLGASIRPLPRLQALAEVTLATAASAPFDQVPQSPAGGSAGVRIQLLGDLHAIAGAGAGLVPGYGSPAWRGFVGLEFAPRRHDWDADRVADGGDACVDVPGSIEARGCPFSQPAVAAGAAPARPGDLDADGVPDDLDTCPFLAEDRDRFEDADGCPDVDNDLDLLADGDDGDPLRPEDWDGVADGDGVPEGEDEAVAATPNLRGAAPATATGPDAPLLLGDTLHPARPLVFEYAEATMTPASQPLVHALAAFIVARPELGVLEVGGHVDGWGPPAWKRWLSQARADAVVAALVEQGVSPDRVNARGYGFDAPLAGDETAYGRLLNRRVEIRLVGSGRPGGTPRRIPPVASPEGARGPVLRPESPVAFEGKAGTDLSAESVQLLGRLAAKISAQPAWRRIEIGVHTAGPVESAAAERLSVARAKSVRQALVAKGVAGERLVPRGFGAEVPLVDPASPEARSVNERVELTVLGRAAQNRTAPGNETPARRPGVTPKAPTAPLSRSEPRPTLGEDEE